MSGLQGDNYENQGESVRPLNLTGVVKGGGCFTRLECVSVAHVRAHYIPPSLRGAWAAIRLYYDYEYTTSSPYNWSFLSVTHLTLQLVLLLYRD